jgi:hypothetical protein
MNNNNQRSNKDDDDQADFWPIMRNPVPNRNAIENDDWSGLLDVEYAKTRYFAINFVVTFDDENRPHHKYTLEKTFEPHQLSVLVRDLRALGFQISEEPKFAEVINAIDKLIASPRLPVIFRTGPWRDAGKGFLICVVARRTYAEYKPVGKFELYNEEPREYFSALDRNGKRIRRLKQIFDSERKPTGRFFIRGLLNKEFTSVVEAQKVLDELTKKKKKENGKLVTYKAA